MSKYKYEVGTKFYSTDGDNKHYYEFKVLAVAPRRTKEGQVLFVEVYSCRNKEYLYKTYLAENIDDDIDLQFMFFY